MAPRSEMKARVSPEARQAIDEWLASNGVSFSGVIEAFGRSLLGADDSGYKPRSDLVPRARAVDAERRSRRPE